MTSIIHNQAGVTTIINPGSIADITVPTVNSSRVVVFDKISGIMNGIADGTAGQFLQTNGSGGLSWVAGGGGGAVDIDGLTDGYKVGSRLVLGNTTTPTQNNTVIVSPNFTGTIGGAGNTFIGAVQASGILTAASNTFVGSGTYLLTSGSDNINIGNANAQNLTIGSENITIGKLNMNIASSASANIVIGNASGLTLQNGTSNICIGNGIDLVTAGRSNTIILGNSMSVTVNNGFFITPTTALVEAIYPVLFNTTTGQIGGMNNINIQTIFANSATINITSLVQIVSFTGTFTGIILQSGTYNGQIAIIAIEPSSTGSLTLDTTPATSRVAGSNNASVNLYDAAGTTAKVFTYIWSGLSSLWIPTVN
jgi:hypothetical protein